MRNPLHALCPYFAMFPEAFVERAVAAYSVEDEVVFDPFSGRGTTLLQSLLMGRRAAASDINPVAFCVSSAKSRIPSLNRLQERISELERLHRRSARSVRWRDERLSLPQFFGRAFHYQTLEELLFLRARLCWRGDEVDCLTLGILHGEMGRSARYLSNQMPRTISSKPEYSLGFWRDRNLWARRRHVFARLRVECAMRLSTERPRRRGVVVLADARQASSSLSGLRDRVGLVVTSPPYFNVTSYEEDQWLRLWFLGGEPWPTYRKVSLDDRHTSEPLYWRFLSDVWEGMRPLLAPKAVLVCRIGGTGLTQRAITAGLKQSLASAFPDARLLRDPRRSEILKRQTPAFRPGSVGCRFEVDYAFALR